MTNGTTTPPLVVALDGPAGAGKSSVGAAVARELGLPFIETGKLYRALALGALREHVYYDDGIALERLCADADVRYVAVAGGYKVILNGEDVSDALYTPEVSNAASAISARPEVRRFLIPIQRRLAAATGAVMEGRDIGTIVFPEARYKFFMDATLNVRARRRQKDLEGMGRRMSLADVEEDIEKRDQRDAARATAPLKRADDAIYVDTSDLDFDAVVSFVVNRVRAGEEGKGK